LICIASPAHAQDLVSGISQDSVEINSSYAGTSIVVFGAIEGAGNAPVSPKDVIVVVRGPATDMTVRRKTRVAGIWVNSNMMKFGGLPAYYYLASTRSLGSIANPETLERYQIGLQHLRPQSMSTHSPAKAEPFRLAAIGLRTREGLYAEMQNVEFLSYSLFRVRIPIPATAPRGEYTVEAYLFNDGTVTSAQSTPLYVDQQGLERRLYRFAHNWPFFYGLSVVAMAILLGWLSSLLIRQPR
jgi:uncharacterized protein (TIGR02186 family)